MKSTSAAGKQRLIYFNEKLQPLPTSLLSLFSRVQFLGNKSLIGLALKERKTPSAPELVNVDESIHSFVSRRFGVAVGKMGSFL